MSKTIQSNDVIRRKAESFALQWHLMDYPTGTLSGDFEAILSRISNDELGEDIMPMACYQDDSGDTIAFNIGLMRDQLIKTFGGLK